MRKVRGNAPTDGGDLFSFLSDDRAYQEWLSEDRESNEIMLRHLRKAMAVAIQRELTDKQREYLIMHVVDGTKQIEIAYIKGVAPSTVSREIQRAKRRLIRCLRYAAPWLLNFGE